MDFTNLNLQENQTAELQMQVKEAEKINNNLPTSITSLRLSYETHSEAVYTSRLLNFSDLPEPKNSDDYYEQNDNIINMEYSGIFILKNNCRKPLIRLK